jgi:hypothetical protein
MIFFVSLSHSYRRTLFNNSQAALSLSPHYTFSLALSSVLSAAPLLSLRLIMFRCLVDTFSPIAFSSKLKNEKDSFVEIG